MLNNFLQNSDFQSNIRCFLFILSMSTIVNMQKTLLIIIISIFLFLTLRQDNNSKKNTLAIVTILMIVGYWLYATSSFINFNNL